MIPAIILAIENEDDRALMTNLFEDHSRAIYRRILFVVQDPWAADDLMQVTLERLIDTIDVLRGKEGPALAAYVSAAAYHTALNYLRDKHRLGEVALDEDLDAPAAQTGRSVEQQIILTEDLSCLKRVWPKLDQRSRDLLRDRFFLKKPTAQMAREWRMKPSALRMALTRAKRKALRLLEEDANGSR